MANTTRWTLFDESLHYVTQTIQHELTRTHGALFAAEFIDDFEDQLTELATQNMPSPPNQEISGD